MMKRISRTIILLALFWLTAGCQAETPPPLPADEYLAAALSWLEAHAANGTAVDWPAVRQEAGALAIGARTSADTYPAIEFALEQLDGGIGYFANPAEMAASSAPGNGLWAIYPEGVIYRLDGGSPAEEAGIQAGDVIESLNGQPIQPQIQQAGRPRRTAAFNQRLVEIPQEEAIDLVLQRAGRDEPLVVTLVPAEYGFQSAPSGRPIALDGPYLGYLDLDADFGSSDYPTRVQEIMREVDSTATCGWILDLRLTRSGDLWSYIAAVGPVLGEGELGGFLYTDGSREAWAYRDAQVFWADEARFESYVRGPIYQLHQPDPPVALLIGRVTEDAGELLLAAFQGRGDVRTFGEPTAGIPHLNMHTPLSDGAHLGVSGAVGFDRLGRLYDEVIEPDEPITFDWRRRGQAGDAALEAATAWLADQPACQ